MKTRCLLLVLASAFAASLRAGDAPYLQKSVLFNSDEGGYARYRIPGIAITPKGTILVTCDARKDPSLGDWSDIDLFLRRSTDQGKTWEAPQKLAARSVHPDIDPKPNPAVAKRAAGASGQFPFDNQTLVVDTRSKEVLFVYCFNYERCFLRRSRDEGATWSAPEPIVTAVDELRRRYPFTVIATGPNHGIQLHNGRLVIPVWLSKGTGSGGHRPSVVSSIYSDDHGHTWHGGEIVAGETRPLVNPSETIAVEMAGGGVMFSLRSESLQHRRAIAYSPDGATQWTEPEFVNDLAEPVCMAGIVRVTYATASQPGRILYSYCDNATEADQRSRNRFFFRKNLTVRLSYDEGRTWPVARTIEPGFAGYSDVATAPDGSLYCFYEQGSTTANDTKCLTLAHFNLPWLERR